MKRWIPIIVLFGLAFALHSYATSAGIGLASDSFFYFSGAENLVSGQGFFRAAGEGVKPITHFPPLYSITLATFKIFDADLTDIARSLNGLLLGLAAVHLSLIVYQVAENLFLTITAVIITLFSSAVLLIYSVALSEPLFIFFMLSFITTLSLYLRKKMKSWLILSILSASAAYLTRYTGAALFLTAALVLLATSSRRPKALGLELGLLSCGMLPPALWLFRNWRLTGSITNRIVSWHPPGIPQLKEALRTIASWILPVNVTRDIRNILLIVVSLLILSSIAWILARKGRKPAIAFSKDDDILFVTTGFVISYSGLLIISSAYLDASTPFDNRILIPLFFAGIILLTGLIHGYQLLLGGRNFLKVVVGLLLVGFCGLTIQRGLETAEELHSNPQGFGSPAWKTLKVVQYVVELPGEELIFTNELDALYLTTGRTSYLIPVQWDPVNARVREDFEDQLIVMRQRIDKENALLVLFPTLVGQDRIFPKETLLAEGLCPLLQSDQGSVYGKCPSPP